MNRRSFLRRFVTGAAVVAIAPSVLVSPARELAQYTPFMPQFLKSDAVLDLATIRQMKKQLCSVNARPQEGQFVGYVHPCVYADLVG